MSASGPPEEVLIFTRYPRPGKVKSRLIPKIGEAGAALAYRRMAEQIIATVRRLAGIRPLRRTICYLGADRQEMTAWLGNDFLFVEQTGDSLGPRMAGAFRAAWERGARRAILVGCDSPAMDQQLLETAFAGLLDHDMVLGPSHDGGYYLIGLHSSLAPPALASLFSGIKWGTGTVFSRTVDRAVEARLSLTILKKLHDIDRPEDLKYLHHHPDPQ